MAVYGYDKDRVYDKLMEDAAKQGNMLQAAIYEQQRNEKIDGEKLGYAKTSKYAQYLPGASSVGTDYMDDLKKAMGSKFTWDADKDESVGAYRKQYLREADRTMQDALAKYGTMTGGIPSSQAVAAASQQADYYKSQLADKIPELRDSAWSKYAQEKQMAQSEYAQRISEAMNRWSQMGYADDTVASVLGVAAGTPTSSQAYQNWSQGFQQEQNDYQKQQNAEAAKETVKENLITLITSTGYQPTEEDLTNAGMTAEEAARWRQYFLVSNKIDSWQNYERESNSDNGGNTDNGGDGGDGGDRGGGDDFTIDDLSPTGRALLLGAQQVSSPNYRNTQAQRINTALGNGTITRQEARFLRQALGLG